MTDHLATYLHDHLAGSHFAIKLLDSLHQQYKEEPLGVFAHTVCAEIQQDQDILQQIIEHVGKARLDMGELAGWLAERASQFKLHRDGTSGGLGTFEALETLTLGIRGKGALWKSLSLISQFDMRLPKYDYGGLMARAEDQFKRVEEQRLKMLDVTFAPKLQ
jgi:hypothetical protein